MPSGHYDIKLQQFSLDSLIDRMENSLIIQLYPMWIIR